MKYRCWLCGEVLYGKYWRTVGLDEFVVFCVFSVAPIDLIRGRVSAGLIAWCVVGR